jgi:hypothetical protein
MGEDGLGLSHRSGGGFHGFSKGRVEKKKLIHG